MRIAVPIHSFEPGGVERVALRLAERWQAAGHDVTVVLGRDDARRSKAPQLKYRVIPTRFTTAWYETIWMMVCLYRYLRREPADVIFCSGNTYTIVCVVMRLLLRQRCPPIIAKISNDLARRDFPAPVRFCYHLWLRLQGRLIDHMVGLAEPMRAEIIQIMAVAPSRVDIIDDPALSQAELVRLSAIERPRMLRSGVHILSIGRLAAQKNYSLLIAAFAKHCPSDARLTIAGDGSERVKLERLAQKLGVANRVALPGHIDSVSQFLANADIFALSSDYEGVPAVIIEALAAGVPIVATDCCASMASLLGSGRFGVITPTGDADQFGRALNNILEQPYSAPDARNSVHRFTLECASKTYLDAMQQLVDARSAGAETPAKDAAAQVTGNFLRHDV